MEPVTSDFCIELLLRTVIRDAKEED